MQDLQKFIIEFTSSTELLRNDVSGLRLMTKNELYSMQGAMEKLFGEALIKMSSLPSSEPTPLLTTANNNNNNNNNGTDTIK